MNNSEESPSTLLTNSGRMVFQTTPISNVHGTGTSKEQSSPAMDLSGEETFEKPSSKTPLWKLKQKNLLMIKEQLGSMKEQYKQLRDSKFV